MEPSTTTHDPSPCQGLVQAHIDVAVSKLADGISDTATFYILLMTTE